MFLLPETEKKKKNSLCYQIKYQHKNIQEQAATTEDILCSSNLVTNRAAEEQKQDTQVRVCCCSARVLPRKEECSSRTRNAYSNQKKSTQHCSPFYPYGTSPQEERGPALQEQPRNKIASVIWSAEQTPNLWIW